MACNNDGGDRRAADKCDKGGGERSRHSMQDFFIPGDQGCNTNTDTINSNVVDLYGNLSIEF